jgi:hypothetical protein
MPIALKCTELDNKVQYVVFVQVAHFLTYIDKKFSPCKLVQETMLLTCTLYVSCFTLDRNTDSPERSSSQVSAVPPGKFWESALIRIGPFLPYTHRYIIHWSSYNWTPI